MNNDTTFQSTGASAAIALLVRRREASDPGEQVTGDIAFDRSCFVDAPLGERLGLGPDLRNELAELLRFVDSIEVRNGLVSAIASAPTGMQLSRVTEGRIAARTERLAETLRDWPSRPERIFKWAALDTNPLSRFECLRWLAAEFEGSPGLACEIAQRTLVRDNSSRDASRTEVWKAATTDSLEEETHARALLVLPWIWPDANDVSVAILQGMNAPSQAVRSVAGNLIVIRRQEGLLPHLLQMLTRGTESAGRDAAEVALARMTFSNRCSLVVDAAEENEPNETTLRRIRIVQGFGGSEAVLALRRLERQTRRREIRSAIAAAVTDVQSRLVAAPGALSVSLPDASGALSNPQGGELSSPKKQ